MSSDWGASPTKRCTASIRRHHDLDRFAVRLGQRAHQPGSVIVAVAIHRLGDAVGVEDHGVARRERDLPFGIGEPGHDAHGDAAGHRQRGQSPATRGEMAGCASVA
jgi:hypothetical protein